MQMTTTTGNGQTISGSFSQFALRINAYCCLVNFEEAP